MLTILQGDALEQLRTLPSESVQCCVTSPPYWGLRDYSTNGQLGLESTPTEYIAKMVEIFREVRRVLRRDGTLWLNMGDSYGGSAGNTRGEGAGGGSARGEAMFGSNLGAKSKLGTKPKDLCGIPWRVAFALQADGWWLRSDIIWSKPNPMPESVTDRPTKAHEYIFLLSKASSYFYDAEAIREKTDSIQGARPFGGAGNGKQNLNRSDYFYQGDSGNRNKRSVWTIATQPYPEAHFATFPEEIPEICILAGSKVGDMILDPFAGSGTTGAVALELGRSAILIELNPKYVELIKQRCYNITPGLALA